MRGLLGGSYLAGMATPHKTRAPTQRFAGEDARARLLSGLPVTERRLQLAGVSTAVLEGGDGPPMVLLAGEFAAVWMRVIPDLVTTHRVIAPDLPGLGASEVPDGPLDADAALAWLGELIDQTCAIPPVLVGKGVSRRSRRSVHDRPQRPARSTGAGGHVRAGSVSTPARYGTLPSSASCCDRASVGCSAASGTTASSIWMACVPRWVSATSGWRPTPWTVSARRASKRRCAACSGQLASTIPSEDLDRIAVPTTLIWGRHDLGMRLNVAEAASVRYGWPLHVIENARDDPAIEQPAAFLEALRTALGCGGGES